MSEKKLEVVGVPILTGGKKLLKHFYSIDVPLKRYFILDNSCGTDETVDEAIEEIWENKPDHIDEVRVLSMHINTGFPPGVNMIIKQNIDCPYWIISNYDLTLPPGEWQKILDNVDTFEYGATFGSGDDEYALFMLTASVIAKAGFFDENFYPVYFDDNDYRWRTKQTKTELKAFPVTYEHKTSSSIRDNQYYKKCNDRTFQIGLEYYISKWGGVPGREDYKTPFNKHYPVDYWKTDPAQINKLRWI